MGRHGSARPYPGGRFSPGAAVARRPGLVWRGRGRRGLSGQPARDSCPPALREGPQAFHQRGRGHQGLEGAEPPIPRVGARCEGACREGDHPHPQEPCEEGRRGHHRNRLRPRGRAHRLGRRVHGAPGQRGRAGGARPLLVVHQARARARLCPREPRGRGRRPGSRRRVAPVH